MMEAGPKKRIKKLQRGLIPSNCLIDQIFTLSTKELLSTFPFEKVIAFKKTMIPLVTNHNTLNGLMIEWKYCEKIARKIMEVEV